MPEARKQQSIRRLVAARAGRRCEYCRCPEDYSPAPFVVEHIAPTSGGGTDDKENLAWACGGCNGHKATAISATDSTTGATVHLFHPRHDSWAEHFAWSDDSLEIVDRTQEGRATIARLHLNRSELKNLRRLLKAVGEHPPVDNEPGS